MRAVRAVGMVLFGWAVAATVWSTVDVRGGFRPTTPRMAALRAEAWERDRGLVLAAAVTGLACLAVGSLAARAPGRGRAGGDPLTGTDASPAGG